MGMITRSDVGMIANEAGVRRTAGGTFLIQPLAVVPVEVVSKHDPAPAMIILRGSGRIGIGMKRDFKLVEGRMFQPGLRELVVGRSAHEAFQDLDVGDRIILRGVSWRVVGIYEDNGGLDENELMSDADTVLSAFERNAYQSVEVQLESPEAFSNFVTSVKRNSQLSVDVLSLADYYAKQTRSVTDVYDFLGYFAGGIMAIGAAIGALMSMFSAVDNRMREIGVLRALGVARSSILISFLVEAFVLGLIGTGFGLLLVLLFVENLTVAMQGASFHLALNPEIISTGVAWSLVIALVGGVAPAIRAVRMPVVTCINAE
jgi:putative ABC transport system permease protein